LTSAPHPAAATFSPLKRGEGTCGIVPLVRQTQSELLRILPDCAAATV